MDLLPPPEILGLPPKYTSWRENQDDSIIRGTHSEKRIVLQVAPTGFGKSLAYITMALLFGGRTVILTSTKGLQSQLLSDFESIGAVDIRGRNAYICKLEHDGTTCDKGVCAFGLRCPLKDSGECLYYNAYNRAKNAPIVITNYAYWMTSNEYGEGLGSFDFMVCDEAHDTPNMVSNFLTVNFDRTDRYIRPILPDNDMVSSMSIKDWVEWAKVSKSKVEDELDKLKERIKYDGGTSYDKRQAAIFTRLKKNLDIMRTMDENWVHDITDFSIQFSPIWPAPYCEDVLFRGIKHIHLTSASVRSKTAELCGLVIEDLDIMEYPHSFPVENRLLIHIPTIRVNYRTEKEDINRRKWALRIDQIIKPRLDRKGIVHTISYKRRDYVIMQSKYQEHMLTHKRVNTEKIVRMFKESDPPSILVSPSVSTGWDFYDDLCRYQIIGKIAYPDTKNKITRARTKLDKEYAPYVAMQELVQAVGRSVRSKPDWAENFIIDDNILWFIKEYGKFAPQYFLDAFKSADVIPKPRSMA